MDFRQTRDLSTVRELVELQLEALSLRPPGHPLRPDMLGDTALSLETLYEASGGQCHPQTLLDARAMYTEGLQLCPVGHPSHAWLLINSSKCFFLVGSPVFDLAAGLQNLLAGLADDNCSARRRLQLCATALPAMERACDALAPLTAEHAQEALDAHRAAIHLLPRAANFGLTRQARLRTVTDSDALARHAAAHAVLACRVREAVEMLEEGRGVFWAQALHLRAAALDSVPEMERSELGRIFSILEQDGTGGPSATQRESELEARRQLNEEAERIIAGIRARPGLERFLMPPAFDALIQSLPEGFVVVLLASTHGHQALLLDGVSHDVRSISLRPVTKTEDNEGEHAEEHASDNPERAIRVSRRLPTGIDVTLESLWSSIVYPVFSALNLKKAVGPSRPRLWWCATGDLSTLPIHAAGCYNETRTDCTTDYIVPTYVPTLTALTSARRGWRPIPREQLAALVVSAAAPGRGHARLPNVVEEVQAVRKCFRQRGALVVDLENNRDPSCKSILACLGASGVNVLHMACHGFQRLRNPLASAFILNDGDLSIEELMKIQLKDGALAFLSACQTAQGDEEMSEQAIHLAACMLFCGFRSVIGTLWSMNDEDGPDVARCVYEALLEHETLDLDDVPYALDLAVQRLRERGVPEARWASFVHMGG